MRGEDQELSFGCPCGSETPPRAWGRRSSTYRGAIPYGNTPTCVGKTRIRTGRASETETPPRAWGRPEHDQYGDVSGRNTPTCVGKTPRPWSSSDARRKHPHVRGEDSISPELPSVLLETPPRAWGRHRPGSDALQCRGNTPTCVGKTSSLNGRGGHDEKHPHVRGEDALCAPCRF